MFSKLKKLCSPALFYFCISMFAFFLMLIQNITNMNSMRYSLGMFHCNTPSLVIVFVVKFLFIIFWTWILSLICKDGHKGIAWIIVLFPFILMFILIALFMLNSNSMIYMTN